VDNGLADELVNNTDALSVMREALDRRKTTIGGTMPSPSASAAPLSQQTRQQLRLLHRLSRSPPLNDNCCRTAPADISAQVSAAVAAENGRIMGILNCEEAKGRESQARALAETPGMTVESAQRILAAAPQSAQARTDTALDRLMETAPGALSAGNASAEAGDDLLNTPV
jgi:ClpP class serine protease